MLHTDVLKSRLKNKLVIALPFVWKFDPSVSTHRQSVEAIVAN